MGISQLRVYERAMRSCSDSGDRDGVEMFGRLIVDVARRAREKTFCALDAIVAKDVLGDNDERNLYVYGKNILKFDDWIELYSPEAPRYEEFLSQADINSWKRA